MDHRKTLARILIDVTCIVVFFAIVTVAAVALHYLVVFLKSQDVPEIIVNAFQLVEIVIAVGDAAGVILLFLVSTFRLFRAVILDKD